MTTNKLSLTDEHIENLILDVKNPRFAELYSESEKEKDLIEYLLYTESADVIAKNISQKKEFYPDEALWVLKDNNKYLVKDGNRRCAAAKALQSPNKYGLDLKKFEIKKLPILIYEDENDLENRRREKHAYSLFRKWERIAKALEVYKLYFSSGNSIHSMQEIDSQPAQLIKLASFYYAAIKSGGEDLKKLLRRGRGKTGGKTIVFERLFKYCQFCGYTFHNQPPYKINISDENNFSQYISAMVGYLKEHPETTHADAEAGQNFLDKLKEFGFKKQNIPVSTKTKINKDETLKNKGKGKAIDAPKTKDSIVPKRGSTQKRPKIGRKQIPPALKKLITECYDLDHTNFSNAKTALTRISFENTLKYVVEQTKYDPKKNISESDHFKNAFFNKKNQKRTFLNFTELKNKFTELIINTGKKKAFEDFDLERPHQIIHNYNVGAISADAKGLCDNLIPLLEFMLQDKDDLLNSLDLKKL